MQQQLEQVEKLMLKGEFSQALSTLAGMDPAFPRVCVEFGRAEAGLGNFVKASEWFHKASLAYGKLGELKVVPPVAIPPPPLPEQQRPKFDFYQTGNEVFVSFACKDVLKEDVEIEFSSHHVQVSVKNKFQIDLNTFGEIVPEKSSFKVTKFKIEVVLYKQATGASWPSLEKVVETTSKPSVLPSAYASKKNWNQTETEPEEADDDPMNTLLKKIYKDADEDTRMAMKKSMQTSGGTVLTTNWKEAKDKDFSKDIKPPAGQVFKDWEGKVIANGD